MAILLPERVAVTLTYPEGDFVPLPAVVARLTWQSFPPPPQDRIAPAKPPLERPAPPSSTARWRATRRRPFARATWLTTTSALIARRRWSASLAFGAVVVARSREA